MKETDEVRVKEMFSSKCKRGGVIVCVYMMDGSKVVVMRVVVVCDFYSR